MYKPRIKNKNTCIRLLAEMIRHHEYSGVEKMINDIAKSHFHDDWKLGKDGDKRPISKRILK